MTRKDYVLIAAALKGSAPAAFADALSYRAYRERDSQWRSDAGTVATYLEQDNPRFDRERFLKACGVRS